MRKVRKMGMLRGLILPVFTLFMAGVTAFLSGAVCIEAYAKVDAGVSRKGQEQCSVKVPEAEKKSGNLTIVLDPGHGGNQSGAARDGETVEEKALNLKIARYLKKELETYENVTVYLTREDDTDVDLKARTQFAVDKKADVMVSLHNNATGPCAAYNHGCTVLAAKDGYKDSLALEEQKLSCNILNELAGLGIENQGILLRDSEAEERYPNGTLADYYAIIRGGIENDIPTVLIEHAFIDSDSDYDKYLNGEEKLEKLAVADATGIARYYQLVKKDTSENDLENASENVTENDSENASGNENPTVKKCELEPLENYREKLVHAVDGNAEHNQISYRTYYTGHTDSENENGETQETEVFERINKFMDESVLPDLETLEMGLCE